MSNNRTTRLQMEDGSGIALYAASMGKIFRVTHIADSDEAANAIMEKNDGIGLIATDKQGRNYLAELYGSVCPSAIMEDVHYHASR